MGSNRYTFDEAVQRSVERLTETSDEGMVARQATRQEAKHRAEAAWIHNNAGIS